MIVRPRSPFMFAEFQENSLNANSELKDKDIVLSAILLKYLGRIKQYNYTVVFSHSDIGKNENCFISWRTWY